MWDTNESPVFNCDGLHGQMKEPQTPERARQRVGNALMALGALLLFVFVGFKAWSVGQSHSGIEAFEAARASVAVQPAAVEGHAKDAAVAAQFTEWGGQPDTSAWSVKRIAEYEAARSTSGDAPHAVLNIEHLDIRVPVYNGADDFNLNRGVARIIGTGRIGEPGNLGIAGHRDGFFRPLKDIEIGDRLSLETWHGTEEYTVASIEIVNPDELHVLAPTDTPTVTLVTCYPFYHVGNAPQRFIVKAKPLSNQVDLQRRRS
jgi:sortase A